MIQGSIHQLSQPQYGNQPHLYVVVIEFSGTRDCLVVPAFSADGFKVTEYVIEMQALGYRADELYVEMDNVKFVTFLPGHTGKEAYWLTSQFQRLSTAVISASPRVGTMSAEGLRLISEHLLIVAQGRPERFSKALLKKLRQICQTT